MKISQMSNEQAADALIRIAEPAGRICDDEELANLLETFSKMKNVTMLRAVGKLLPQVTAIALKKHRQDLYEIIGALAQKSAQEVAQMNFKQTIQFVKDSYDDILQDFFTPSAKAEKTNVVPLSE